MRVLVLGGTLEARRLSLLLAADPGFRPILSLAGRTRTPEYAGPELRVGGFGGALGLSRFLHDEAIACVVDATHPFALRMRTAAHEACRARGVPYLRLERPPWRPEAGDRWHVYPDLETALEGVVRSARRVFAVLARHQIDALGCYPGCRFVVRTVEPLERVPANVEAIAMRPPYRFEEDLALLRARAVEALLFRNSGGLGGSAKIRAARVLGLAMHVIEPALPKVEPSVATVAEAYEWLRALRAGRSR